jgi:hypothetical protein
MTGVAFVALIIPAIVMEILGPDPSTSPITVFAKFHSGRTDVQFACVFLLAALVVLLLFVFGLAALVQDARDSERFWVGVSRAAGSIGVAVVMVYVAVYGSIAAVINRLRSVDLVYALFRAAAAIDLVADLFFAVFVAAIAFPLMRAGITGRWYLRFGVITAAIYGLGSLGAIVAGQLPFDPIGTILILVWILVLSIRLLRAPTPSPA